MLDLFNALVSKSDFFWFFAIAGSTLFIFQIFLSILGTSEDDGATDPGNFKWLTKQAITGFLMMFGWVGLTCQKEFHLLPALCIAAAFVAGLVAMGLTAVIFRGAKKLHSSGHVYNLEETLGKEAVVYQQISKEGSGKVSISIQNMMYEINAVSLEGEEFPSFTRVKIIKKADEKTVVVTSLK